MCWISGYNYGMAKTKVLVSLDPRVVERMDKEAAARGVSRSALLEELAANGLGVPMGPGARPEVQRALKRLAEMFKDVDPSDATAWLRGDRDSR